MTKTREYRVWTREEELALKQGVKKHGLGAWEVVRKDPELAEILSHRSGVQLKDKWRNLVKFKHVTKMEAGNVPAPSRSQPRARRKPDNTTPSRRSRSSADGQRTDSDGGQSSIDVPRHQDPAEIRPARGASRKELLQIAQLRDAEIVGAFVESLAATATTTVFAEAEDSGWGGNHASTSGRQPAGGESRPRRGSAAAAGPWGSREEVRAMLPHLQVWKSQAEARLDKLEASARVVREDLEDMERFVYPEQPQKPAPQRHSARAARIGRKRYMELDQDEDEDALEDVWGGSGSSMGGGKRQRLSASLREDTRFGIYDERRYKPENGRGGQQRAPIDRVTWVSGDSHKERLADRSPRATSVWRHDSADFDHYSHDEHDMDVVNCPCGANTDDGTPMVECEVCQEWAHTACVAKPDPRTGRIPGDASVQRYICARCKAASRMGGPRKGGARTPAPVTPAMPTPRRRPLSGGVRRAGARGPGGFDPESLEDRRACARGPGGFDGTRGSGGFDGEAYGRTPLYGRGLDYGRDWAHNRSGRRGGFTGSWDDQREFEDDYHTPGPRRSTPRRSSAAWPAEVLGELHKHPPQRVDLPMQQKKRGKNGLHPGPPTSGKRNVWRVPPHLQPLRPWAWSDDRRTHPPGGLSTHAGHGMSGHPHDRRPWHRSTTPPTQGLPPLQPSPPGLRKMPPGRHIIMPLAPSRSASEGEPLTLFQPSLSAGLPSGFTPWNKDAPAGAGRLGSLGLGTRPSPPSLPPVKLLNGRTSEGVRLNPFKAPRGRSSTPGLKSSASVGALERQEGDADRLGPNRTHSDEANHYEGFAAEEFTAEAESQMIHPFDGEEHFDITALTETLCMLRNPNPGNMDPDDAPGKFPLSGLDTTSSHMPMPSLFCEPRGGILDDADARHLDQPGGTSPSDTVRTEAWLDGGDWDERGDAPLPPKKAAAAAARSAEIALLTAPPLHNKGPKLLHRPMYPSLSSPLPDVPDDVAVLAGMQPPGVVVPSSKPVHAEDLEEPLDMPGNPPFPSFTTMATDEGMFPGHEAPDLHHLLALASEDVRQHDELQHVDMEGPELLMSFAGDLRGKSSMHDLEDDPGLRDHTRLDRRKLVGSSGDS